MYSPIFILLSKATHENRYFVFLLALRNPKLHRDIIRAIIKASNWLKDQQDVEGKWLTYHTTGYAVSTLRLIGQGLNSENNCDGRPLVLDSFKKLNGTFHLVDGGKLAHIIIGLRSLCANTSNYMGNNLTDVLFKKILSYPMGSFSHPFQYALAVIALRLSNGTIPLSVVNKLINDGRTLDGLHGGDTMSLISMALSGIESQAALPRRKVWEVRRTGQKMLRKLKEAMFHENTTMNLYTKSLVMQVCAFVPRVRNSWCRGGVWDQFIQLRDTLYCFFNLVFMANCDFPLA